MTNNNEDRFRQATIAHIKRKYPKFPAGMVTKETKTELLMYLAGIPPAEEAQRPQPGETRHTAYSKRKPEPREQRPVPGAVPSVTTRYTPYGQRRKKKGREVRGR